MNFLKIWVDMALLSFCICCINTILIGKNICFLHAESPDEFTLKASSLEYILDRCSRKGKNRMCLTWWHIPYFGQRQEWSAKWGTHCSISTARPKRHSTTCLPATAATRRGFRVPQGCWGSLFQVPRSTVLGLWWMPGKESWCSQLQADALVSGSPFHVLLSISSQFILFVASKLVEVWLL